MRQVVRESARDISHRQVDREYQLTMTSTVSYKFTTTPFSSMIGTAEIPLSENICTTSNTLVLIVAVAIG